MSLTPAIWLKRIEEALPAEEGNTLSPRSFAGSVGLLLLLGLSVAGLAMEVGGRFPSVWIAVGLGLLLARAGFELTVRHDGWNVSLAGMILTNAGVGLSLSPLCLLPEISSVWEIGGLFWIGLAVMTIGAWIHPLSVRMFGTFLLGAVGGFIVYRFGYSYLPEAWGAHVPGMGELLFTTLGLAYLDYYWTRTIKLSHNLNNAVDSSAALYADVFASVLKGADKWVIMTRRRRRR